MSTSDRGVDEGKKGLQMSPDRASLGADRSEVERSEVDRSEVGRSDGVVPDDFLFGVATAGYQVEGGFNGPGEPANNWLAWEQIGKVEPSGSAVGFWERPEESLDRAAALGCNSFRMGIEWARVVPDDGAVDRRALDQLRLDRPRVRRSRPRAAGDAPPLHPPGVAGRGVLAPSGRARPFPRLGRARGRRARAPRSSFRHRQRDQRGRSRIVVARDVSPRAVPLVDRHRARPSTTC